MPEDEEMIEDEKECRETKRKLIMTEEEANAKLKDLNGLNIKFPQEDMEEDFDVDREGISPTITGSPDDCDVLSDHDSNGTEFENGEKPFFCSWKNCQKRFANKFLLKKHHFIHTGLKPHICQFCKKPFNRKDNLLRHKKTHLQNGMSSSEGFKRRHNMLRGITEQMAIELQLLPLNSREGRQRGINDRRSKMGGGGGCGTGNSSSCSDGCGNN